MPQFPANKRLASALSFGILGILGIVFVVSRSSEVSFPPILIPLISPLSFPGPSLLHITEKVWHCFEFPIKVKCKTILIFEKKNEYFIQPFQAAMLVR